MSEEPQPTEGQDADPSADLPEQLRVRLEKRQQMLEAGIEPYLVGFPRTHSLAEVRTTWPDLAPDEHTGQKVGVTGRVMFLRTGGKLCFATLHEGDGTQLQVMLSEAEVGEQSLADWKAYVDLGDHVGVTGEVISSRRGELSVLADSWAITAKALRPLPNVYEGAQVSEDLRVRRRYVDLIARPEARTMARLRPAVVNSLRKSFEHRGFIEVETPMLQTLQGGATARPFVTHSNAFDLDLFLRIAPELYLKRCVVGGLEQVFEINRNFRNEGADSTHSPEFAMLEAYQAYGDYDSIALLTRELVQEAALATFGTLQLSLPDGVVRDLSGTWDSVTVYGSLSKAIDEEVTPETPLTRLRELVDSAGISVPPDAVPGRLVEELFEHHVLDSFDGPTFVRDFPVDTSPLVRAHRSSTRRSREVGPVRGRGRARHRLHGAGRSRRAARTPGRAVASAYRRGCRGHAARRGLPPSDGARHAADGWHGNGDRPVADAPHGHGHSGDDPVPHRQARGLTVTGGTFDALVVRPARTSDIGEIRALVDSHAEDGRLLNKATVTLYEDVQEFIVASTSVEVVGCGALHVLWEDLAEIRTVAVATPWQGKGVGSAVLSALIERAAQLGIRRLFCLTFETGFFGAHGFAEIAGAPVSPEVYKQLLQSYDEGVAEFLDLERVKPNTLGNTRMLRIL